MGAPSQEDEPDPGLEAVNDFVRTVHKLKDHGVVLNVVSSEIDRFYQEIAKTRLSRYSSERREQAEANKENIFVKRLNSALKAEFVGMPQADQVREHVIGLAEKCKGHVEELHKHLGWSAHSLEDDVEDNTDLLSEDAPDFRTDERTATETEYRPLRERNILDAEVRFNEAVDARTSKWASPPPMERTVFLSNLPMLTVPADIHAFLAPCGEVESVHLFDDWVDWQRVVAPLSAPQEQMDQLKVEQRQLYTLRYAMVVFKDPDARRKALRPAIRVFGILFSEYEEVMKKAPKTGTKVLTHSRVSRTVFPQPLDIKRCLLLRDVEMVPAKEVLQECARVLGEGFGPCELSLTNGQVFNMFDPLTVTSDQVDGSLPGEVDDFGYGGYGGYDARADCGGVAVLRFSSFQEAFVARQALRELRIRGRPVAVGFPPWRPVVCSASSDGQLLPEDLYVDLPLPRASAKYMPRSQDPILRFGVVCHDDSVGR